MFGNPSLMTRIAIGKSIGLIIGLFAFFAIPNLVPEISPLIRWGVLLWYITFGAIIGVFGVFTYHPILRLPFPWWVRAPFIGAWLNFVLAFFAYEPFGLVLEAVFGTDGLLQSPFWLAGLGAILGTIIGFFATRYGGEGKEAVDI